MNKNIEKLAPQEVWTNFKALCAIPHPSKHEKKICDFVVDFAKKLKLEVRVDKTGNVMVTKPATKGMEKCKGVILQAHLDMVPQKNSDKKHDFTKDPIEAYIDGDWVTANGTTLGADNGMGCAAMMAVLQSKTLVHGPLEALFTVDEETGMTGAFGLQKGALKGDILINLDSEDEGELYVGCAGGIDATISLGFKTEACPKDMLPYKISLTGLKGGHSGMDIILGRGNANKLMNRLFNMVKGIGVQLANLDGGSLRNAIPRESFATVVVPKDKKEKFEQTIEEFFKITKAELSAVEPDYVVKIEACKKPSKVITKSSFAKIINLTYVIPNGVVRMSDAMPGLVETSTNLAIAKTEKEEVILKCLLRSSVDSAKMDLADNMVAAVKLAGGKISLTGAYPGWKPNPASDILKTMQKVYKGMYKKTPEIKAIHAGLECGLLGGVYPNWDMISCGPTIRFPHSPDEKVNIASVQKFWDFLTETLKNTPKK